jgi:heme O synthase-like polyprenyltransferase
MRKLFITIASIFSGLGLLFAFLPLGTIALIPVFISLIFAFLAFKKSVENNEKKVPKVLLVLSLIALLIVIGKELVVKDEVIEDQQFDQEKVQSEIEAQKDLEELEGLE